MNRADGPWIPPKPSRGRVVIVALLGAVAVLLILGARAAFNDGLTGDFPIYFRAADATAHGRTLEQAAAQGFLPPPLCATVIAPLGFLSQATAAKVWAAVTFALFAAMFWVGARDAAARWRLPNDPFYSLAIAMFASILSFGQLRAELRNGQVDGLLVAGFVFGLAFLERRPGLAGLFIGFAANIKYTAVVLIPYLLFRRRFKAAVSALASTVGFALLPAIFTGWQNNLTNLSISLAGVLRLMGIDVGQRPVSNVPDLDYSRSVSLTSVFSRLLLERAGHAGMYAALGTLAACIVAACWAIYRRRGVPLWTRPQDPKPEGPAITSLEWCGMIVAVLLFSPQSQVRHMVVLLPLHLAAPAIILLRPRLSGWLIAGLVLEQAGLNLPPGSFISDETSERWRATGWPCWCLLGCYFTLLWTGLRCAALVRTAPGPNGIAGSRALPAPSVMEGASCQTSGAGV